MVTATAASGPAFAFLFLISSSLTAVQKSSVAACHPWTKEPRFENRGDKLLDIAQKAPLPPSSRSARLAFISPRSVTGAVTQRNDPRVGTLNLCAADGPPDVSSAIAPRLASQSGGAFAFDPSGGREWHSFLNLFKAY
jgi:hypothetical protein